mgnify:CR=1 FL=1
MRKIMQLTLIKSKVSEQVKSLVVRPKILLKTLLSAWGKNDQQSLSYIHNPLSIKEECTLGLKLRQCLKREL